MRVDDVGVGPLATREMFAQFRKHGGRTCICSIDMQPDRVLGRDLGESADRIDAGRSSRADSRYDGDWLESLAQIRRNRMPQGLGAHRKPVVARNLATCVEAPP